MADLDPKLTFDAFVVGPANRLAAAAARRAAESPGSSYNPLFIYSASGLGKSHILGAIAHHAEKAGAAKSLLYESLENYLGELAEAIQAGKRDSMKDRFRELDVLLLDDVQFLTGQAEAQEMLLTTLDALTVSGSQIVLASDRPPAEINGLDARLVSRFSGGLIVDIAAPEYETRVAILRRKTEARGHELEPGVAEAIARFPFKNVRELGGALNRVLAIQDLEERRVRSEEAASILEQASIGLSLNTSDDDFSSFLDEISADVAEVVDKREPDWRRDLRKAADAADQEGFRSTRLRELLDRGAEPEGWQEALDTFQEDLAFLRSIDEELDRLNNPWPELTEDLIRDPDRLDEAQSFLESVRERRRPFAQLGAGPDLAGLADSIPALALKAAEQLVNSDKPEYNPLYLWAEESDGPHALLGGTARSFRQTSPGLTVAVTSVPAFADDFIRALSNGVAGAWRERWWTVDLLLVYGAQALAETERVQDEFFHLFEALKRRGSRVLIASDRPPAKIEAIDERLRSRFEGGLVLEVESADVPAAAADLTLALSGESAPAVGIEMEGGPALTEEEAISAGSAQSGPVGSDEPGEGRRRISQEKVVWHWPELEDRLVEHLE